MTSGRASTNTASEHDDETETQRIIGRYDVVMVDDAVVTRAQEHGERQRDDGEDCCGQAHTIDASAPFRA